MMSKNFYFFESTAKLFYEYEYMNMSYLQKNTYIYYVTLIDNQYMECRAYIFLCVIRADCSCYRGSLLLSPGLSAS